MLLIMAAIIALLPLVSCTDSTPAPPEEVAKESPDDVETPPTTPADEKVPPDKPALEPAPEPDIVLPNIFFTTPETWTDAVIIGTGEEVAGITGNTDLYVAAWLFNDGTVDIEHPSVTLHIDGEFVKNLQLKEDIPAGDGVLVCVCLIELPDTVSLAEGDHEFSFTADYQQAVKESDESDNIITATVYVPSIKLVLPDIEPFLIDGKASIIIDHPGQDYKSITIKAGIANTGNAPATDVVVDLKKNRISLHQWNVGEIPASEHVILEVTLGEIIEQFYRPAGSQTLELECELSTDAEEIDTKNNNATVSDLVIALKPTPRREPQSDTETKLQEAFDNCTWYTNHNKEELLDIAKEVLKDVPVQWNTIKLDLLPFDKYNDIFAETYGETEVEKELIKEWLAVEKYKGISFCTGSIVSPLVYIREGTIMQVLPPLIQNAAMTHYAQRSYNGYRIGGLIYADRLAASLLEAYSISIMREKYGLDGLVNMSISLDAIPNLTLIGTYWETVNLRRIWAIAVEEGYPEGRLPSETLLEVYMKLTGKPDPTSYLEELDMKGDHLDTSAIVSVLYWRMVDKELTMLPESIAEKIGTDEMLSLDELISYQNIAVLP